MVWFRFNLSHISRNTVCSAVQSAAYISRCKLFETRRGIVADCRPITPEVSWETLAPEGCGVASYDLLIWDRIDGYEDIFVRQRYRNPVARASYLSSARTAQLYVVTLPKIFNQQHLKDLLYDFCAERFVARGLIVTWSFEEKEEEILVHLQVSCRSIDGQGNFSFAKTARMLAPYNSLLESRQMFADRINHLLEASGLNLRVESRSLATRKFCNSNPDPLKGIF